MEASGLDRLLAYARTLGDEPARRRGDDASAKADVRGDSPRARGLRGEADGVRVTLSAGRPPRLETDPAAGRAGSLPNAESPRRVESNATGPMRPSADATREDAAPPPATPAEGRAGRAVAAYRRTESAATGHLFRQKA